MGLDMYLTAKLSTYKPYGKEKEHKVRPAIRKALPEMFDIGNIGTISVSFEAGYWRKANQIHAWFVKNVQDDKDDCGDYYVSRENLEKLKADCKKVIKSLEKKKTDSSVQIKTGFMKGKDVYEQVPVYSDKDLKEARTTLPATSGFFFGSTEYDEYYIKDIQNTISIINKCLKLPEEWSFKYHSSW